MSEKRFECDKGSRIIIDNETKLHYIMTLDWECRLVTKLLNNFVEENEQLNKKLQIYKFDGLETLNDLQRCYENAKKSMKRVDVLEEENEQLKQFQEDVFNKIDMHLRMLPTARDNVNGEYGDSSLYSGAIYILETLKKELEND